jgi:8-oxo-dGTP pyrophosphatase MutT (NUDIX family)
MTRSKKAAKKGRARREESAGGIVFRVVSGEPLFLLIRDSYGNWGFPKGHLERGERAETAALREVMEETGLRALTLVGPVSTIEWWFRLDGDLIHKSCQYFLMETESVRTKPQTAEGISDCRWMTGDEALDVIPYENARAVFQQARDFVKARQATAALAQG